MLDYTFLSSISGTPREYSWRYYTTGVTGITGDYLKALRVDHDGNSYIADYTPGWEEGGISKFNPSGNGMVQIEWDGRDSSESPVTLGV